MQKDSKSYQNDGLSKEHLDGSINSEDYPKIMNHFQEIVRR
ncbi:hypothetical protein LEP1GSC024_4647 [Leptospira noguchii str. 2001034031]|uniref:Uncharacterized protein n=1 Tax=Leptospira noguchii str. 2001034031 TaxID=1193053 RepID=M6YBE9_9LEPT|nr:hypothetical protein LEP1GSC024_4647 [Leptospira noguchii str. 2001034031]